MRIFFFYSRYNVYRGIIKYEGRYWYRIELCEACWKIIPIAIRYYCAIYGYNLRRSGQPVYFIHHDLCNYFIRSRMIATRFSKCLVALANTPLSAWFVIENFDKTHFNFLNEWLQVVVFHSFPAYGFWQSKRILFLF